MLFKNNLTIVNALTFLIVLNSIYLLILSIATIIYLKLPKVGERGPITLLETLC